MEVTLRIVVVLAAAGVVRMLTVFGLLPFAVAMILLVVIGATMSKGLKSARAVVAFATSASYVVAWCYTQPPVVEAVTSPDPVDLLLSCMEAFAPFVLPAVGSAIMLVIERRKRAEETVEEITEESLLAEKLPAAPHRDLHDLYDAE